MTEKQAQKKAEKTLDKMTTWGWIIRVWESSARQGWHFELSNGPINLHTFYRLDEHLYWCTIGKSDSGNLLWASDFFDKDPNTVVSRAVAFARRQLDIFTISKEAIVKEAERIMKRGRTNA